MFLFKINMMNCVLADGVGFEPTDALTSTVFKTAAIDHSATRPDCAVYGELRQFGESFCAPRDLAGSGASHNLKFLRWRGGPMVTADAR